MNKKLLFITILTIGTINNIHGTKTPNPYAKFTEKEKKIQKKKPSLKIFNNTVKA